MGIDIKNSAALLYYIKNFNNFTELVWIQVEVRLSVLLNGTLYIVLEFNGGA